jgi:hypothetical protein
MMLCPRSRLLLLFLENVCHRSSDFISRMILTKLHTSVQYVKTSNEFAFHDDASKVKVTVTVLPIVVGPDRQNLRRSDYRASRFGPSVRRQYQGKNSLNHKICVKIEVKM